MSKTIPVDHIASEIAEMLEKYTDEVSEQVRSSINQIGKETVQELKQTSPRQTGQYAKGWSKRVVLNKNGQYAIQIYNQKKPSLTHLLEYGHKKTGGGMVPARQHIRPAEEKATQKLIGKVKDALN